MIPNSLRLWAIKRRLDPHQLSIHENADMYKLAAFLEALANNDKITVYDARKQFVADYPHTNVRGGYKSALYLINTFSSEELSQQLY